jgi:hypothetical protein
MAKKLRELVNFVVNFWFLRKELKGNLFGEF